MKKAMVFPSLQLWKSIPRTLTAFFEQLAKSTVPIAKTPVSPALAEIGISAVITAHTVEDDRKLLIALGNI